MVKNAYIHIPFCKSKCKYCSFVSYPNLDLKNQYLLSLKKEICFFYKQEKLNTLYIGGGTPSLLSVNEIQELLSLFVFENSPEITVELNPETIDKDYLRGLKKVGVNRISLGCQTFNDDILKLIGRRHDASQVIYAVENAKNVGFENISLDFIYGLPLQSLSDFEKDLNRAVSLDIPHISLYGLKIDEGSYFYKFKPENLPDDDMQAQMYLKAIEILTKSNFMHYEISNFAKRGFYSRHNTNYWDNNSYYGFGISAHGYVDGVRYSNVLNFDDYFDNPCKHFEENLLSKSEQLEEEIFLGFRKMSGINVDLINKKYNIDFTKKYSDILKKYLKYNYIQKNDAGYSLTKEGILISNYILADFIE